MKRVILVGLLFGSLNLAHAVSAPSGMLGTTGNGPLDGTYAFLWNPGVTAANITAASITFTGIAETVGGSGNNFRYDFGSFVGINTTQVAGGTVGTTFGTPPTAGNFTSVNDRDAMGDAFQNLINVGKTTALGNKTFSAYDISHATPYTWTYVFNAAQLVALNAYISAGAWGFEIDPDCHFRVGGIDFNYTQGTPSVPDAVGTFGLLGAAIVGLLAFRRKLCLN